MKKKNESGWIAIFAILSVFFIASCSLFRETPPDTNPDELKASNPNSSKTENDSSSHRMICKSIGAVFTLIPAGEFTMGNNNSFEDEKPEHKVKISREFWVATTETTQSQYKLITGENPSFNKSNPELPVEQVSWNDAVKFCKILTEKEKENLPKGYIYRLPTEAEWEYMCKKGEINFSNIDEYAWHSGNSGNDSHKTAQKKADKNGLYDTIGNVWEWCLDSCDMNENGVVTDTYKEEKTKDPLSKKGSLKIHRGGSWCYDKAQCTTTRRYADEADFTSGDIGFRIVLAPELE